MLHLLPVRTMLRVSLFIFGLAVLSAAYEGWIGHEVFKDAVTVFGWSSTAVIVANSFVYLAWRWLPAVQNSIFPYLGGRWSGHIEYRDGQDQRRLNVSMEVKHTLFGMQMLLESEQSSSRTCSLFTPSETLISRDIDFTMSI